MGGNLSKKAKQQIQLSKKTGGTDLNLSDCELRKLGSFKLIVKLKLLIKLDLSRNYLQTIPQTVSGLVNLEEFKLSFNEISVIPFELCQLSNLKVLLIECNQLEELPSPSLLAKLASLRELNMGANKIHNLPPDFAQLKSLTSLNYSANGLNRVPDQVFALPSIRILDLSGNAFPLPDQIGKLSRLERLNLSQCKISVLGPHIATVPSLTYLDISKNQLTTLPDEILQNVNLRVLKCDNNYLSSIDNLHLSSLKNIEEIYLSNNQLDHLTRGFGTLHNLRILDLSHNQLTALVREIGWLGKSMRKLNLAYNKLMSVPGELTFLNRGADVELENNPLSSPFVQWYENSIVTLLDNLGPFLRAYPDFSFAFGDSITQGVVGQPAEFTIQAKDYEDRDRMNGGDEFEVIYVGRDPVTGERVTQKGIVKDLKNGKYTVFYNFKIAGKFTVDITESGVPIKGSPFPAYISPGPADASRCWSEMGGMANPQVGKEVNWHVVAKDKFGNKHDQGGAAWQVDIRGPHGSNPKPLIRDGSNGEYDFSFTPGWAGQYVINVGLSGEALPGSPFELSVSG